MKPIFLLLLIVCSYQTFGQSRFYRQHWVEYEGRINNNKQQGERTRVNDRGMSTQKSWYTRFESQVNGLAIIGIPDTILHLERAELFAEMWGGHPKTANKRFQVNGGRVYPLPSEQTEAGFCEYLFPLVPIDYHELVRGNNAIQFLCDRGETFWGHFLMEEIGINCYYRYDAPELVKSGLKDFSAVPKIENRILADEVTISLKMPLEFINLIEEVHYFGRYYGVDASGTGSNEQWHEYLFNRKYTGNIGTATTEPFTVKWNTSMLPDQGKPMAVKALIKFKNGFFCWSDILDGLTFPLNRKRVQLYQCTDLPAPFWSRDRQVRFARLELPDDISAIESAELHVRIWDGGEGTVKEPFKLNGVPYKITAGDAPHKLIYTIQNVKPEDLNPGVNEFWLMSDTEHHGIEVLLPGPCLVIRYK
jgi:hypothetical protein